MDFLIGTQPFDDGFLVEKKLYGSTRWSDYLMKHCVSGEECDLRVFVNERDGMDTISAQYDKAEAISPSLTGGCICRKNLEHNGVQYCLVRLKRNIEGKDMPTAAVVRMCADICQALADMQAAGAVHRNVKPTNITFRSGQYYLNSFDLMEKLENCDEEYIVGTPAFMAPEALDGAYSFSTDVYSLGLTMYCLLNGHHLPFVGQGRDSSQAMDLRINGSEIPVISSVAPELMGIIRKACAFDAGDRYQNAQQMLDELTAYLDRSRRRRTNATQLRTSLEQIDDFSSRWSINSVLGSGAYGVVFDVTDRTGGERYAMKVIPIPALNTTDEDELRTGMTDEQRRTYFETQSSKASREALVWSSISSCTNIVRLHESGKINDPEREYGCYFYMCSELLSPIETQTSDERTVARIAMDICRALTAVHGANITHRDIKPENILYSPNDGYKLGDFGIAKLHRFKANATVIGTVPYMPPEILKNYYEDLRRSEYDNTVDIYSLGLTMYTLLNEDRGPFITCPASEITDADIRSDNISRAKGMEFPDALHASAGIMRIIKKACAYEPSDRYASAEDMYEALADFLAC